VAAFYCFGPLAPVLAACFAPGPELVFAWPEKSCFLVAELVKLPYLPALNFSPEQLADSIGLRHVD